MGTAVTYVGPFDAVEVPDAGIVVEHGATVEVDSAIAKSLLEQPDNWARPKGGKAKAKAPAVDTTAPPDIPDVEPHDPSDPPPPDGASATEGDD